MERIYKFDEIYTFELIDEATMAYEHVKSKDVQGSIVIDDNDTMKIVFSTDNSIFFKVKNERELLEDGNSYQLLDCLDESKKNCCLFIKVHISQIHFQSEQLVQLDKNRYSFKYIHVYMLIE